MGHTIETKFFVGEIGHILMGYGERLKDGQNLLFKKKSERLFFAR